MTKEKNVFFDAVTCKPKGKVLTNFNGVKMATKDIPNKGELIYIDGKCFLSHGEDDYCGGLATIKEVIINNDLPIDHCNYIMIIVSEIPRWKLNYKNLLKKQKELKERYGNNFAYPDPDYESDGRDDVWRSI